MRAVKSEFIGPLSQAGGTISLGSSRLKIGGAMLSTDLAQVAVPTLAANNRYFIYAVNNSGAIQLVVDQNVNSVGPSGFSAWKLVGAFYANGVSPFTFGVFVNIEGCPVIDPMLHDTTVSGVGGAGSTTAKGSWSAVGKLVTAEFNVLKDGNAGAGGADVTFTPPQNLTNTTGARASIGATVKYGQANTFNVSHTEAGTAFKETTVQISGVNVRILKQGAGSVITGADILANAQLHLLYQFHASELSNTPLKDL